MSDLRLSTYADLFAAFFVVAAVLEANKKAGREAVVLRYDRIYNKVLIALAETGGGV